VKERAGRLKRIGRMRSNGEPKNHFKSNFPTSYSQAFWA
jgi:hypothetical protein